MSVTVGISVFWYNAVGRVQVTEEEAEALGQQSIHLALCLVECLAEKI